MNSDQNDQLFIVEDDVSVQNALIRSLHSQDLKINVFGRPSEILKVQVPTSASCMIVDLCLPEMDGLELLKGLRNKGWQMPFIIITGYGDVAGAVSAMQLGALHFLEKPVDNAELCKVVSTALEQDRLELANRAQREKFVSKLASLTPRETDVLQAVVLGKLNKQIAHDLGLSIKTIETHRANLTRKLDVNSVAQLVRLMVESTGTRETALHGVSQKQ